MQQTEINFRKKRELGVIISDSFDFLKQEKKAIWQLLLIYVLPFVVLYAVGQVYLQRNVLSQIDLSNEEALMKNIGPFYMNLMMYLFFGLFVQSLLAGTYYSYIEAYIKKGKGNFELSDISSNFFANSLLAIGANLTFLFLCLLGFLMFVFPIIYFANTFSLLLFIFIYEKKGLSNALTKSRQLVHTQWWNTLVLNLLAIAMLWGVGMILSIPNIATDINTNLVAVNKVDISEYPSWYWLLTGVSVVVTTLLMVIPFTFQAFQYFNLEERENPKIDINSVE